jgi:hypothetical protein
MEESKKPPYWSAPTPPQIAPAETVEDPGLRATFAYWTKLKGARAMPARTEISPKDIRHALSRVHIYDVIEDGADFRMRLVGTNVFPGLEEDQTGKLLSEHPDPGVRLRFAAALAHVAKTGSPARSISHRQTGSLLGDAHTEGLWLPLGAGDRVEHVLAQSVLVAIAPGTSGFGAKP